LPFHPLRGGAIPKLLGRSLIKKPKKGNTKDPPRWEAVIRKYPTLERESKENLKSVTFERKG